MPRPVAVARELAANGVSLRKAHDILDGLAAGEHRAVEVRTENVASVVLRLGELGISARRIRRPTVDPKQIREGLALSQKDFATRFGLELRTIQNWEQGRYDLDPAATILLALIRECPGAVESVLIAETAP